ncbi:MAG: bifunctional D-glycero-beta-D-manno-heptose-7-phosphate kinase/D-glycero-beta-D-manno-heptose 1-phosphate adenylyltransferase HldE [Methylococcaceae bacterium]|nr:MAG: bifunctional D-glycero-beta-D-manno-heptose-7-phosphate kinase/D-glycero-beta-D-manno-heptose 1-phosphate adenylyltransferase HldE [Methylococcaceae bacterium]
MMMNEGNFASARILVVGDIMLDRYWFGHAARISPEAPVPVVKVQSLQERVGGAANVALNIAHLGGKVSLLGVVGDDHDGQTLYDSLGAEGVRCEFVVESGLRSICKLRVMAQHQQLIRVDFEETPLHFNHALLHEKYQHLLSHHDVVVFSDYGKGTLAQVANFIHMAKRAGVTVLIDPKGSDYQQYAQATIITPNLAEFQAVVGVCHTEEDIVSKGRQLLAEHQLDSVLLTRGEAGMTLIDATQSYSLAAQAKDVFDVTGAGDTVIAVMALAIAVGKSSHEAMYWANLAAGIVVGKVGTATVSIAELRRASHDHSEATTTFGVVTEAELSLLMAAARARNERLIMTNGCFDLLHVGHVSYLQQAKALGDRLIVAVNADDSVKQLKGESRPINGLAERMTVLAALACVDWVVPFYELTPERLYCQCLPDVIVKGGDYRPEDVAGGECVRQAGGEVKILHFVEGHSTTAKIQALKHS